MTRILLLLFAGLKFSKLFLTVGSMLLSLGIYALVFGWRYAAGFVAMLFIHETGHLIAARKRGLAVGLPTFIPFVGAWIQLKEMPHDAETEAYVGLGGPLLGTVGALACWYIARNYGITWLLAVSYAGIDDWIAAYVAIFYIAVYRSDLRVGVVRASTSSTFDAHPTA